MTRLRSTLRRILSDRTVLLLLLIALLVGVALGYRLLTVQEVISNTMQGLIALALALRAVRP